LARVEKTQSCPLCLEEKAFRKWLLAEGRKKRRAPKSPGRPSEKRRQTLEDIEELHPRGRLKSDMLNKEVYALVKEVRSPDTLRRARKQFAENKISGRKSLRNAALPPDSAQQK
jgi:hypothetical protein